jgi:trimeric autotransporter adhesin
VRAIRVVGTTVYLGGAFTQVGGAKHSRIAAVKTGTGAVIAGFHASANAEVFALASSGSSLFMGGGFTTVDGTARANMAAVNTTSGAILPWSPAVDGQVRAIRLLGFPRMVIAGSFTHLNGSSSNNIGALDGDTGQNLPWQDHTTYPIIGLASDPSGVYAAGAGAGGNFASFDPGTGNQKWLGGTNGNVQAIGVVGGEVYVGGHFQVYCGPQHGQHTCTNPIARDKLLAVNASNGNLLPWAPGADSALGVFALTGAPATGALFSGGDFRHTGNRAQQGLAMFLPS